ncbi:hypothetical protein GIB67_015876 [Kingdonia uniflora]|uniref:FAS1 domain-containing protein n=1 Tax=Kingdonia uniflora TaxID=39325 RepID=A0A7J7NH54_9MAGN|nr:hypothetical protein GIB67_015876 [Kingdonia uniflora]
MAPILLACMMMLFSLVSITSPILPSETVLDAAEILYDSVVGRHYNVAGGVIEINGVKVNESVVFDVGLLAVFAIDEFFDPSFKIGSSPPVVIVAQSPPPPPVMAIPVVMAAPAQSPSYGFTCTAPFSNDNNRNRIGESLMNSLLKSRGYSVMASFLDLQLLGFNDRSTKLTVFAPLDEEIEQHARNFSADSSIFHRHVLPCRLTWTDLVNFDEGATLRTFVDGFTVKLSTSGDVLVLNGVPVIFPDLYSSDSVVVHGLQQMLLLPGEQGSTTTTTAAGDHYSSFNFNANNSSTSSDDTSVDYGEIGGVNENIKNKIL